MDAPRYGLTLTCLGPADRPDEDEQEVAGRSDSIPLMPSGPVSQSSRECVCDVCSIADIEETIKQARLLSFIDGKGQNPYMASVDVSFKENNTINQSCPVRKFLSEFLKEERSALETELTYTVQLGSPSEEEVAWHYSQFPHGQILRRLLSINLMGDLKLPSNIYLALENDPETGNSGWFPGVPLKPLADFQLIKDCLADCEATHGACKAIKHESGHPKKVIDVHAGKVIISPKDCRYLALSYVWGPKKQPVPVKVNAVIGSNDATAGGLGQVSPALSDALSITRELGENYLWIDALCIDQADSSEKAEQIKIMNIIYERAVATIVLLQRSSWDHIPGTSLKPRANQVTATLQGHKFRRLPPNVIESVKTSPWASRAWTKQEGMLSRRCIVISDQEVASICRQSCTSESNRTARTHIGGREPASIAMGIGRATHQDFFARTLKGPLMYEYFKVLEDYSQRQMSYESDALNAMQGVLQDYQLHYDTRFFWGLPIAKLQEALAWTPSTRVLGETRIRRSQFPSWSWASYSGPIRFLNSTMSFCQSYRFGVPFDRDPSVFVELSSDQTETEELLEKTDSKCLVFYALSITVDVLVDERNWECHLSIDLASRKICKVSLDNTPDAQTCRGRCS